MKKIILGLFIFFVFIININALDIYSSNAILYNLNEDTILFEKNSNDKVYIASLTKIVTAITILDNVKDLNEEVTITYDMISNLNGYSVVGLKVGNKISYMDLLYALLLPSAADASQALAIGCSGSINDFVKLMNKESSNIGAKNSHFSNPYGRDDDNYSTVGDMAIILKYALQNDTFKQIFETNNYEIKNLNMNLTKSTIYKANFGNIDISLINGSKTGFTDLAGNCLASTSFINGVNYMFISVGAPIKTVNEIDDAINIYSYYGNNYSYKTIVKNNQLIKNIPIKDSFKKDYSIYSKKTITKYLDNYFNINDIVYEYNGINVIDKSINKGDLLGTVNIKYKDSILDSFDVYLENNINYYNIYLFIAIFIELFILIILLIVFFRIKVVNKKLKVLK